MKKKKNYLHQVYKMDTESNAFIIEVSLDGYNDIFNEWDQAPFKRRDMHPDLKYFLEECSFDIPLKYPLKLHFHVPKKMYDEKKEQLVRSGLENNFKFNIHFTKKGLEQNRKNIILYVVLSFSFLLSATVLRQTVTPNIPLSTLIEGIFIGGWVFLWEAFSLFFFTGKEIRKRLKEYERFTNTDIQFKYI